MGSRTSIISSRVVKVAQDYYGCNEIDGMLLENEGSIGSADNHWESTILREEVLDNNINI
jgi:leishmanolysin